MAHRPYNPIMAVALLIYLSWSVGITALAAQDVQKNKMYETINARQQTSWETAKQIWNWAEPGYQETKSSALLIKVLRSQGFDIESGVAGMPTAFTATFGEGKPVIGMLGEYDALPGLSQQAVPQRAQTEHKNNGYGHGCGHHLLGVASMEGAIAIAQQIKAGNIQGTIRYYGCPAEEGGSAKVFMVNAGLFKDCDAVLHWHPSSRNSAGDRSTLARNAVKFRFHGKAAHAAGAPEQGRSALDAVELTNFASQLLREHTPDGTRIHHVITAGGGAPNVVPEFAEVYYYIRHPKSNVVRELYKRLVKCAEAGALATETKLEINFQGGILEILPNNILAQVTMRNLRQLNDLEYDDDNVKFAIRIQQSIENKIPLSSIREVIDTSGTVGMGSTDVGDVSWVVPTTGFNTACFTPGVPGHSWQAVASGGTDAAGKGLNLASRVIAATAWDLYHSPEILAAAKSELQQRLGSQPYNSLMVPGQKPSLDYREPPVK
ncbi:MAG: amidohydrolase [Pirellulaceae bacterium]|nr:amidohydrolase [Pirellulaceae bacterium]